MRRIWADAAVPHGSVFHVMLPLNRAQAGDILTARQAGAALLRALRLGKRDDAALALAAARHGSAGGRTAHAAAARHRRLCWTCKAQSLLHDLL
jgi:hypothetical protein